MFITTLVVLDEHHQFTKYLAEITSVNLINDKEEWALILLRAQAEIIKNAIPDDETIL